MIRNYWLNCYLVNCHLEIKYCNFFFFRDLGLHLSLFLNDILELDCELFFFLERSTIVEIHKNEIISIFIIILDYKLDITKSLR